MTTTWLALLGGALLTGGLAMAVIGLLPTRPDLAATVRLHLAGAAEPAVGPLGEAAGAESGWVRAAALPWLAERLGLRRLAADLRVVGMSTDQLAGQKVGYGLLGLTFPALLATLLAVTGVRAPFGAPVAVSLVLGGVLFWLPETVVRRNAAAERESLRRATGAYIDLVALERLADAGPTEALHRAAAISDSAQFAALRDALVRAELAGRPTWAGLRDLSERTAVVELADLADIMSVAGRDGAAVYSTLRARAASLRTQLLTGQIADANSASERMVIPLSALGLCFMALIAYPAFVRILFG